MPTIRRLLVFVTALLATAVLTVATGGCSKKAEEPLPDAAGLVQQSVAATKALESAHLAIVVNGKIPGLPVKTLTGDLTNVPSTAVSANARVTMGGSDLDADLVVVDGTLYLALSKDNWLDMGPAAEIYDPSVILNPTTGLANMLATLTETKSEGFEAIGGVPAVKIAGKASADAVNKLIPQLEATGGLPATVWIEKKAPNQLVQAVVEQSPGNTVTLTLSDWDKPVTVTKPAV